VSALSDAAHDYVALRRAVGFKLIGVDRHLGDFVTYVEARGDIVTVELALAWAGGRSTSARGVAQHLGQVRGFARYLQALCPDHEVPPSRLLAIGKNPRRVPYLYSPEDIGALMDSARALQPLRWGTTVEIVIGLLAATGMRIGEVLALDLDDVDHDMGLLTIRLAKFNKSRLVALAPSTREVLDGYVGSGRQAKTNTPALFVMPDGRRRLGYEPFRRAFGQILAETALSERPVRPVIHDLRHSFAVSTLLEWYRSGVDVEALLPRLSLYLGHVNPAATYWYLTGAPELMALAAERLDEMEVRS
jgi:integrase/recombinase XerD